MEKKKLSLPAQIFIALLLGIVVGLAFYFMGKPEITTNYLKPFGTIFVNLLKFIVVPVVLLSMIDGIVSMGDMKKVGSVGWKTVAYFLVTTAIACVIGLVFANIFNNAGWFPTLALEEGAVWDKATSANFMDTLVAIFPSNMWKSFTEANMLQVIVIALIWRWTGYNMVFYLAGLQNIDYSVYEASYIDGATPFQQFMKITIPLLKPTILLTAIMSTSGTLQLFDESVNLTSGGPGKSTMTLAHYVYNISFVETPKFNYAAAISVFILVSVAVLSAIQMKVGDKRD